MSDEKKIYGSAREKFLGLSLASTRKSYYPQLRKNLETVKKSEMRLKLLIDNIPATLAYIDSRERYVLVNREYEKVFGLKCDEFIGKRVEETLSGENYSTIREYVDMALSGRLVEYEMSFDAEGDDSKWLKVNYVPEIDEEGRVLGFYALAIDLTEKKIAEKKRLNLETELQQAQKMESIGTLAGGIAHEFNNIIGIILGNAELATDDVPKWNPASHNLNEIKVACFRAKDIVNQLLSFSRKKELEKKPTDIGATVNESLTLIRSSLPASVEIRQHIESPLGTILADVTQINQILINLCTNADHSMAGGGVIEVVAENIKLTPGEARGIKNLEPGSYVRLVVSDTGSGIPEKEIDRIFDPYYTTKEIGKGTGMGLSVVHGIIMGLNGAVQVTSDPGKGTKFKIFFPVTEEKALPGEEAVEGLLTGDERILFVDDEVSMLAVGEKILGRLGYDVHGRLNPLEALELFSIDPYYFDLVITDMTMPYMSGDQLASEILAIRSDMPVLICTGFSHKIDKKKARAMGIKGLLMKPVVTSEMTTLIRTVLDDVKTISGQ